MSTARKKKRAASNGAKRGSKRAGARSTKRPSRAASVATSRRPQRTAPAPKAKHPSRAASAKAVRYVALLRGVSPMNAKMPELARCFEAAGFTHVKTVLGSGNVVFSAPRSSTRAIEARALAAMQKHLDRPFPVIVRTGDALAALVEADPWQRLELAPGAKQVVTFLARRAPASVTLPAAVDGARILAVTGSEVFTAYVHDPSKGPVFMGLLERTFGKEITTRTWDTVKKLVRAAAAVTG